MIAMLASQGLRKLAAYIGCAVLVLALLGALWARGNHFRSERDLAKSALAQTEANYRAAASERKASDIANVARVGSEGSAISKDVTDDYQANIDRLRADYVERVRIATQAHSSGTGGADLPGVSPAPGGVDEAACAAQFPDRKALIASETAEQLIALQDWNRKVAGIDVDRAP